MPLLAPIWIWILVLWCNDAKFEISCGIDCNLGNLLKLVHEKSIEKEVNKCSSAFLLFTLQFWWEELNAIRQSLTKHVKSLCIWLQGFTFGTPYTRGIPDRSAFLVYKSRVPYKVCSSRLYQKSDTISNITFYFWSVLQLFKNSLLTVSDTI